MTERRRVAITVNGETVSEEYYVSDAPTPAPPMVFMPLPYDGAVVISPDGQRFVLVSEPRYWKLLARVDAAIGLD